jgi:Uri superfamily endonuclease
MLDLPALHGAYALELYLPQQVSIEIGRLGVTRFPAGALFYLGSAHGPGGLKARLSRHLQPDIAKSHHWHIDYLRGIAQVRASAYLTESETAPPARLECLWSQALIHLPGSCVPLPGFGASDCRLGCPAHLLAFPGDEKSSHPLLERPEWLAVLVQAAGSSLVISRSLV